MNSIPTLSPDQPLLLAAWSTTTTARERFEYYNSKSYNDTPRSRWEAHNVAASRRAVTLRNERAAQLRTLDRLQLIAEAK